MAIKTVIDTNVIAAALSTGSQYHWLIEMLLDEQIELFITEEIFLEYEKTLKTKYSEDIAADFLVALNQLPNVLNSKVYYRRNLIADPGDNKFVDCYIASNAEFLISLDKHFSVLRSTKFPTINIVNIEEFKASIAADEGWTAL